MANATVAKSAAPAPRSSLLLKAADEVNYARNVTLKSLVHFADEMIAHGEHTDDGLHSILAIQLFAQDTDSRLAAAERALDAARKAEGGAA